MQDLSPVPAPGAPPAPKRRRTGRTALIVVGSVVGVFIILAAVGAALGPAADSAHSSARASTSAPSSAPSPLQAAAPARPPADGGSYPNAAAVLAALSRDGSPCAAPSPMNGAPFYPGATSMIICNSPGGRQVQDSSAIVFDNRAALDSYIATMTAPSFLATTDSTVGLVTGVDWALSSTPAYARTAHAKLGGSLQIAGPSASSSTAGSDGAALLGSAGPLGAYIANGNEVFCDQSTAYYESDGSGGVRVQVSFVGPGVLNVDGTDRAGSGYSQEFAEGAGATGHEFDLAGLAPSKVNEIDLGVTSAQGDGTCQVQPLKQ